MSALCKQTVWGRPLAAVFCTAGLLLVLAGCHDDMYDQPRYDPLEPSAFFDDGMSARPLVPGTIARGMHQPDIPLYTGMDDGRPAEEIPLSVTRALVERGQERFNIHCSPCHGLVGDGDGMIVHRGFRRPPSFHIERLRAVPVGHFFLISTNGIGAMPPFARHITPEDRWAIAAYVRALQLSQNIQVDELTPEQREKLPAGPEPGPTRTGP